MEGVAVAARTGKAALYRRWADKDELVIDAMRFALPSPDDVPLQDDLREDLLALMRCQRAAIEVSKGTTFDSVRAAARPKTEMLHAMHREKISELIRRLILEVLRRGVDRGEVRPEAVNERTARVGPAMLVHYCVTEGPDVPDEYLDSLVDDVLLPIVRV
jgi:AcrR family transcriptional regulator